jgi:hypothetical protein
MTTNCLSGFGSLAKKLATSSNDAIPSHCPRMTSVGTVILLGSTTDKLADMSDVGSRGDGRVKGKRPRRGEGGEGLAAAQHHHLVGKEPILGDFGRRTADACNLGVAVEVDLFK